MELPVLDTKGKEVKKIELDASVFDGKVNNFLIHQAVTTYLGNQRKGLACTKTRGEVSGGGRKPWRQKGTGRARVGSIRSPLWRKGGVVFGPKLRSYRKELPKKMRIIAFKSVLNAKVRDTEMIILDEVRLNSYKTKEFVAIMENLQFKDKKISLVVSRIDDNLKRASRNMRNIALDTAQSLTTIDVANCEKIVLTCDALREVEDRVKRGSA